MLREISSFIVRHTVVSRASLTPELSLRLITPASALWHETKLAIDDPFWGFYWPGGQAVARYILDNESVVRYRKVIDIGCGCGAISIAAAKMKAKKIVANDIDTNALTATKINAALNEISNIEFSSEDFIGSECTDFDTIFIGDMFYDEEFAAKLFQWLHGLAQNDKDVLIGDPGRYCLTDKRRQHLTLLAKYKLPENSCIENIGFDYTSVWRLNK